MRRTASVAILLLPFSIGACSLDTQGSYATPGAGTTGSGAGTGGSAGTGAGGSAGEGGSVPVEPENCQNGVDDDGNGQTDCEDAACAPGYECVPEVPAGFTLSWVIDLPYLDLTEPPTCPDGTTAEIDYVGPASATDCAPCDCAYTGYTCTGPTVVCAYYANDCNGNGQVVAWPKAGCQNFPNVSLIANWDGSCYIADAPKVDAKGTCTGAPSAVMNPKWERQTYVCRSKTTNGKGCAGGGACVPKQPTELAAASTCILSEDPMAACPAGWTTTEIATYDDGADDRACSSCECNADSVKCTGGGATIYDDDNCVLGGETPVTLPSNGTCQKLGDFFDYDRASINPILGTPQNGTCTTPLATGAVTTTGPRKVCCK